MKRIIARALMLAILMFVFVECLGQFLAGSKLRGMDDVECVVTDYALEVLKGE